jgi:hypothetical protein
MKLDKKKLKWVKMSDSNKDDYVEGDMAFIFGIVWELTAEAMSFQRGFDDKSRLQRTVVNLLKQRG